MPTRRRPWPTKRLALIPAVLWGMGGVLRSVSDPASGLPYAALGLLCSAALVWDDAAHAAGRRGPSVWRVRALALGALAMVVVDAVLVLAWHRPVDEGRWLWVFSIAAIAIVVVLYRTTQRDYEPRLLPGVAYEPGPPFGRRSG